MGPALGIKGGAAGGGSYTRIVSPSPSTGPGLCIMGFAGS